ncbi:hypothetical protein [Enterobacter sp. Bisph1]|uniref:hypothetical protein n=1 Tax=Enterobacter sp. Bisph1 TaxID=1274399 RepID=UPI00057BFEA2|nr:hypothetical protein [Enterobacter sp. Bisph1]
MLSKDKAASEIQNSWFAFTTARRADCDNARALASVVGRKITSMGDTIYCLQNNKIIVQVNGVTGDPWRGHSCFYADNVRKHMVFLTAAQVESGRYTPDAISKYPVQYHPEPSYIGKWPVIITDDNTFMKTQGFDSILQHLCRKGRLFVLHDVYAAVFENAIRLETINYKYRPFTYGLHYNCNRFVINVLKRLIVLKP